MEVVIKPINKPIEALTINDDADSISQEAVFTLCDELIESSFVVFDGVTYTTMRLPDFIYALNKRFGIDLEKTYNHCNTAFATIMQAQMDMMEDLIKSIE